MKKVVEFKPWQWPPWLHYANAIWMPVFVAAFRYRIQDVAGNFSSLLYFTLPVAFVAVSGGLIPGLIASIFSLLLGMRYFILPGNPGFQNDIRVVIYVSSTAAVWLFICIVCDLLRRTAKNYYLAVTERDCQSDRLTTILDGISDAFFAVDNDWKCSHTNQAFDDLAGQTCPTGGSIWESLAKFDDGSLQQRLTATKEGNRPLAIDIAEPSGVRWFHIRAFPDEDGLFVYIQDVTYRKEIDARRERLLADERRARSEAERASQLKDEFVATLSHELRTPLTSILGWSEILKQRAGDDERLSEGLCAINRSTKVQAQLIEELLDMSRINGGKVRLEMSIVSLNEIVAGAVAACKPIQGKRNLSLNEGQSDVLVRGDPARLQQIVSNLLSNAFKFTSEQGTVSVKVDAKDELALIEVRDDGQGIGEEFLPHVFERFRQATGSASRIHGGLGLGLSIVRQLTELHGGKISAESLGVGQGSTFTVQLPAVTGGLTGSKDQTDERLSIKGVQVLVVEDDEATRGLLTTVLEENGATVESADSAVVAMQLLKSFRPGVLISDIGMPEIDGYQFIGMIRALSPEEGGAIPAIALSAFARPEDAAQAIQAGFHRHLPKPIDIGELLRVVNSLSPVG